MSVSVGFNLSISPDETITSIADLVADTVFRHKSSGTTSGSLDANSTVPATKVASDSITLSGGTATIDLSALVGINAGTAVNFTGLKVQLIFLYAKTTNTSGVVFVDGASNGYNIFGDASGSLTLLAGSSALIYCPNVLDDVGSSDDEIDVSSSDADAIFEFIFVAG